jgi:hypothetical protein
MPGKSPAATATTSRENYVDLVLRRCSRILLTLGVIATAVYVVTRLAGSRRPSGPSSPNVPPLPRDEWPPLQAVSPEHDHAAPAGTSPVHDPDAPEVPAGHPAASWVDPVDGICPTSHPVKAKLASRIFHLPGMLNYDRTAADRCYVDGPSAEADGLRPAKR